MLSALHRGMGRRTAAQSLLCWQTTRRPYPSEPGEAAASQTLDYRHALHRAVSASAEYKGGNTVAEQRFNAKSVDLGNDTTATRTTTTAAAASFTPHRGSALDRKHDFIIENLIQKGKYRELDEFCLTNMASMTVKRISVVFKKKYKVHLDAARQQQLARAKELENRKKNAAQDGSTDAASRGAHVGPISADGREFMVSPVPTSDAMLVEMTKRLMVAVAMHPVGMRENVSINCISDLMKALELYPVCTDKTYGGAVLNFLRAMTELLNTVPKETTTISSMRMAFLLHTLQHSHSDTKEVRQLLASLLDFAESKNVLLDCAKDVTVACHALNFMQGDSGPEMARVMRFVVESIAACAERFEPFHVARIMKGLKNMGQETAAMRTVLERLAYELNNNTIAMKGSEVRMCLMGMRTAQIGNAKVEMLKNYNWSSSRQMLAAINRKMDSLPRMTPAEVASALHGLGGCVDTAEEVRTAVSLLYRIHMSCLEQARARPHLFTHHDLAVAMRIFANKDIKGNRDLSRLFAIFLRDLERGVGSFDNTHMRDGSKLGSMLFNMQGLLRTEGGAVYHPPALDFLDLVASRIHRSQHLNISAYNGHLSSMLIGLRGLAPEEDVSPVPQLGRMLSAMSRCMNTKLRGETTFPDARPEETAEAIVLLQPFSMVSGATDLLSTLRRQALACRVSDKDCESTRAALRGVLDQAPGWMRHNKHDLYAAAVREIADHVGLQTVREVDSSPEKR